MIARFFLVPVLFFSLLTPVRAEWPQCGTVNAWPGAEWPQADPGRWNRDLLRQARALSRSQDAGAAVMVVYRGHLVARWGDIAEPRLVQSVRKQLLSSLVGLEVKAGRLHLDDTLADLGVNDTRPPLTPAERKATLRDLLESRSGIFHSAHYEVGGWRRLREKLRRQEEESGKADAIPPGKLWIYNNWDFNTVGDIVEQSADRPIGPYFRQAIADPLGMQDFRADDVEYTGDGSLSAWMLGNHSIHPAYAFRISARDLARYGVLWLGCGQWNGQQVLPASWVLESTRGRDTLDGADPNGIQKDFGYFGYLWWVDRDHRRRNPDLPGDLDVYYASGAGGHRLYVFPSLDLVIAHEVDTPGGVGTFSQIWRRLFDDARLDDAQVAAVVDLILAAHPERQSIGRGTDSKPDQGRTH